MWFAALGSYQHNRWYVSLVARLLKEPNDDVVDLLAYNPFPKSPPKYIRSEFYRYQFTDMISGRNGSWWHRTYKGILKISTYIVI